MTAVFKFLEQHKDEGIGFEPLWQRIVTANEEFFRREKPPESFIGFLTKREMLFLAKMFRYAHKFAMEKEMKKAPIPEDVKIETIDINGVPAEWQIVPGAKEDQVLIYLHGGGYIMGSPLTHKLLTVALGQTTNMRVLSVNYRLGPEYSLFASLDDSVTVYKELLSTNISPQKIIIAGDSAGAHLTITTLLKLRDEGIPLPAGAILMAPLTDMTLSDATFFINSETDPILADVGFFWWGEAAIGGKETELTNPIVSPLLADLSGLPPLLFQASPCEILYSDSVRFVQKAKAAGVDVTLQTWDEMPHNFQLFVYRGLPEAKEAIAKIGEFVQKIIN
ncbi:MAG: alpha/beta hydrolase [Candidatus Lokiarchaeota archaeon]|nr:alpha/beta hydrolase [Candidatus Lokiarchaeota archaeon]